MNEVIPFTYEDTSVRAVATEDGTPWFVASDVAKILGYRMASDMTRRLDEDERGTRSVRTLGGTQEMTVITESGLYSAILGSKVEGARQFKRWVTHEVLPSIRKRGGYLTPEATEKALTDPDFIIQLATSLKEERAKRAALEAENEANKPKVLFADAVATSHTSILVGQLAKILNNNGMKVGQNRLFKDLRARGYLSRRHGCDWNMPTQKAVILTCSRLRSPRIRNLTGRCVSRKPRKSRVKASCISLTTTSRAGTRSSSKKQKRPRHD